MSWRVDGRGGMSSLCHDVGLGYGVCSLFGVVLFVVSLGDPMLNGVHVEGGVLLMYRYEVGVRVVGCGW